MGAMDAMYGKLTKELEDKVAFQNELMAEAEASGKDPTEREQEMFDRATTRIGEIRPMLDRIKNSIQAQAESRKTNEELAELFRSMNRLDGRAEVPTPEYRTAGA